MRFWLKVETEDQLFCYSCFDVSGSKKPELGDEKLGDVRNLPNIF
jgi:hypothetical protein